MTCPHPNPNQTPLFRTCETCGGQFGRKTYPGGQIERAGEFLARRFCSRKCNHRDTPLDAFNLQAFIDEYPDGAELETIGAVFKISKSRVQQIEAEALNKMRIGLIEAGVIDEESDIEAACAALRALRDVRRDRVRASRARRAAREHAAAV